MGISLHSELEPIGHTHKQHLHASLAVLLASQAQKRLYDDAFKLTAVEDAERQPTELLLESLRLIMTYSNNTMKVFCCRPHSVATLK